MHPRVEETNNGKAIKILPMWRGAQRFLTGPIYWERMIAPDWLDFLGVVYAAARAIFDWERT